MSRAIWSTSAGYLIAALLGACRAPSPPEPAPAPCQPSGTSVSSVALAHGPWGAAISSDGVAYVTRPRTDSVALIALAGSGPIVMASFQVGARPDDIVFNASGSTAYVTNLNAATVGVINTAAGAQVQSFPVPGGPLRIVVGPGQNTLYVTLDNGALLVLDAATGALDTTLSVGMTPNGLALNAGAGRLYVSATGPGTVTEINTINNTIVRTWMVGGTPQDMEVLPGRNALYIANEAGWVDVRDLVTGARTDSIPAPAAFALALSPDGEQVWVAQSGMGRISVIDVLSSQVIASVETLGVPRHIAFPPLGEVALVANEAGVVQLIRRHHADRH